MIAPKRKLIQKRHKRKERYAKIVRKRERSKNNLPSAQVQSLKLSEDLSNQTKIYKLPMGFVLGEKDGQPQHDISVFNHTYQTNSVDVTFEEDKIVTIKLHERAPLSQTAVKDFQSSLKNECLSSSVPQQELSKQILEGFQELFKKNELQMNGKISDESLKKHASFRTHLRQALRTTPCCIINKTFERHGLTSIEVSFNSKFVDHAGFQFDEFSDALLRSGIPKMANIMKRNGKLYDYSTKLKHMLASFEQPQLLNNFESYHITHEQKPMKVNFSEMMYGNFTKRGAELSIIVCCDQADPIPRRISTNLPLATLYNRLHQLNTKERKDFLKHFYPSIYLQMNNNLQQGTQELPCVKIEQAQNKDKDDKVLMSEVKYEIKLEDFKYNSKLKDLNNELALDASNYRTQFLNYIQSYHQFNYNQNMFYAS